MATIAVVFPVEIASLLFSMIEIEIALICLRISEGELNMTNSKTGVSGTRGVDQMLIWIYKYLL